MIYLLLGDDLAAKDAKILEIKNKLFKNSQAALAFDYDNIDGHKLPEHTLKKALLALPVIAPFRLVIVRGVHKLKSADMKVLLDFCQKPPAHSELILESSEKVLKDDLKGLALYAKSTVFAKPEGPLVWDLTKCINSGQSAEALKILHGFYQNNMHPLQIMPALIWYWGQEGRVCGKERFKKGLEALQEADLNIKRSRLDGQYAVEKLVVELGLLRGR